MLDAYIEYKTFDKDKKLKAQGRQKANSFVGNFLRILRARFALSGDPFVDHTGVSRVVGFPENGTSVFRFGLDVGTSSTPVNVNDHYLKAVIPNGTGAGMLSYSALDVNLPTVVGSETRLSMVRSWTNLSGSSITINEIGWIFLAMDSTSNLRWVLGARDVVSANTLFNGDSTTYLYTIITTT